MAPPGCGFACKHVVRASHVTNTSSRKSACKYDLTITELRNFSCAMGFVRTFMSHYSQVLQILERFNGDLTKREVQGNVYAMDKINRLGFPKYQAQASACSCAIDPERPLHSVPSKKI